MPGILAAPWNAWRETQEPTARLVDVLARPLTCWAADATFSEHEAGEDRELVKDRAVILAGLRRWTLHDFDREPGYFTRPSPLCKPPSWRRQRRGGTRPSALPRGASRC